MEQSARAVVAGRAFPAALLCDVEVIPPPWTDRLRAASGCSFVADFCYVLESSGGAPSAVVARCTVLGIHQPCTELASRASLTPC